MRRVVRYILILSLLLEVGCSYRHKETPLQPFDFSFAEGTPLTSEFEADGGTLVVEFNSFYNWVAQSSAEWIDIKTNSGTRSTTEFVATIAKNATKEERDATITIHLSNGEQHSLAIHQLCSGFFDHEGEESYNVTYEENLITIPIRTNIEYSVSISDQWLSVVESRAIEEGSITLKVEENLYFAPRTTFVEILDGEGDILYKFTVSQEAVSCHNNEIIYLTSDNAPITLANKAGFGSTFQSNTHNGVYGRISFESEISAIANNAFSGCSNLMAVIMPDRVTAIGREAFKDCSALASVKIPKRLIYIGSCAMENCSNLSNINIPSKLHSIGESAFLGCENLAKIYVEDIEMWLGISFKNEQANPLCNGGMLYLNINSGAAITDIVIPDAITEIGNYAFYGYSSLTSLTLHSKIESIGTRALYGCGGELHINCPIANAELDAENAFYGSRFSKIVIGTPVSYIGNYSFANMNYLTEVVIAGSVMSIGDGAFKGCNAISELTVPSSVISFGKAPFEGCTGKLTLNCGIPDCTYVDEHFLHGALFSEIVVGEGVTYIGRYGFYGYNKAEVFRLGGSVSAIGVEAFGGCTGELFVECSLPSSRVTTNGALSGSKFSRITLTPSVQSIGTNALFGCEGELVVECAIPHSSTATASPFYGSKFTTIKLLVAESISDYAFSGYASLQNIILPETLTAIGKNAFQRCSGLETVILPGRLCSIGDYAFAGCSALKEISIPDSVESIGSYALYDCAALARTAIGKGVLTFGQNVFYGATGEIEINSSLPSAENNTASAFYGANFTKITFADAAETLGTYAISSCPKLTEVVLGSGITQMESCAIYNCSALSKIGLLATVPPAIYFYSTYKDNAALPMSDSVKISVPTTAFEVYTSFTSGKPGKCAPENWYYFKSAIITE